MKASNPFAYADKVLLTLRKQISAEFQNAVSLMPFDELNVIYAKRLSQRLYRRLEMLTEMAFVQVARQAYKQAFTEATDNTEADVDESAIQTVVATLMASFHPMTGYVYDNEIERKESRAFESIVAARNRREFENAMGRAARLWFNMGQQYVDFIVDAERLEGFRSAGVQRVRWVTAKDEKVCSTCGKRDGHIYSIDDVPEIPAHYRCRCYLVPVREN